MKRVFFTAAMLLIGVAIFAQDGDPGSKINIWQILSGILLVTSMFFGSQSAWVKAKGADAKLLGKEAIDVLDAVLDSIADNTITPEEVARIKREALELRSQWRKLIGR